MLTICPIETIHACKPLHARPTLGRAPSAGPPRSRHPGACPERVYSRNNAAPAAFGRSGVRFLQARSQPLGERSLALLGLELRLERWVGRVGVAGRLQRAGLQNGGTRAVVRRCGNEAVRRCPPSYYCTYHCTCYEAMPTSSIRATSTVKSAFPLVSPLTAKCVEPVGTGSRQRSSPSA